MSLFPSGYTGSLQFKKIMVLAHAGLTACPPFSGITQYSTAQLNQAAAAEHAAACSRTLKQPQLQAAFLNIHLFFCMHCGLGTLERPAKWLDSDHSAGSVVAASVTSLLEMQAVSRHPKPSGYSLGRWLMLLAHTGRPGRSKHATSQQAHSTLLVGKSRDAEEHRAWCGGLKSLLSR